MNASQKKGSGGTMADGGALRRRTSILSAVLLVMLAVLGARLVHLQHYHAARFQRLARRQHIVSEVLPARPGDIRDASGRILATSVLVKSLYADPAAIDRPRELAGRLAEVLDLDVQRIHQKLTEHPGRRFVWLKRRLTDDQTNAIKALNLDPAAVGLRKEYRRFYPQGRLAVQLLGFRNVDGKGRGGVEQYFDNVLRGRDGVRRLVRDARGRKLDASRDSIRQPVPGEDVVLTINAFIQTFAEQALDQLVAQWRPAGVCAVVLDPRSGDVLAMASRPTLDPNAIGGHSPDAWRNRTITDVYEPGSTFKPFVLARALDIGAVRRHETIFCENGLYRMGRRLLHDHHPFGSLSLVDVVVRSSNIGMAKIGQRLGNTNLHQAVVDFGFGRPTGIELPGEAAGKALPLHKWTSYSTGSIPMGHEISVTPLQLITAYGALANGGRRLRPRLVRFDNEPLTWLGPENRTNEDGLTGSEPLRPMASKEPDTTDDGVEVAAYPAQPETAQWILDPVLRNVVESPRGTGRRARLNDYTVFGKSGTAQKAAVGGYSHRRHVSSFLVGGPLPQPRALVLVMVDEPQAGSQPYGGKVAAPAAAQILERTLHYLHVAPNDDASPNVAALPSESQPKLPGEPSDTASIQR